MQLRTARELSGKTQSQVARKVEITATHYQNIEYEKSEPGVQTAIRIARALNSTVEDLFGAASPSESKAR